MKQLWYKNIKNKSLYVVLDTMVENATNNSQDEPLMVLYKDSEGTKFIRGRAEFYAKFEKI